MFRGLISDAKAAVGAVIVKYVARASVAIPFVIAAGFATAALTLLLTERYGAQTAYWLVAGGFTLIGALAMLVVTVKEQEEEVAEAQAVAADTPEVATEVAVQAPLALLSALLASPMGPTSALGIARLLGRNLPLVLLLVVAGFLLWPTEPKSEDEAQTATPEPPPGPRPNGIYPDGSEARV
ncbi:MAG TPA: hypothetical protein VFR73_05040 [Hyphomicrobiaceae bacterium]|nr:hypothetical protein [Hyphomicrobiaceae bacterium]